MAGARWLRATVLFLLPPVAGAVLGSLTAECGPGASGEWAPLGYAIITALASLGGAFVGLLLGAFGGVASRERRWIALLAFPIGDGLVTPAAFNVAAAVVDPYRRRFMPELLLLYGPVCGGVAGVGASLIGLLVWWSALRRSRRRKGGESSAG